MGYSCQTCCVTSLCDGCSVGWCDAAFLRPEPREGCCLHCLSLVTCGSPVRTYIRLQMLSESWIVAKMKVPVLLLLAVLGCSLAEGRLVPECELWSELKNATANLTLNGNNLVAKRKSCFYTFEIYVDIYIMWTGTCYSFLSRLQLSVRWSRLQALSPI